MKSRQFDFGSFEQTQNVFKDFKKRTEHGHEVRMGQRKLARPLDLTQALHLILRSELARGGWSFLKPKNKEKINDLINYYAEKCNVKIFRYANCGNHLHLLIKAQSKKGFRKFLRTITALIPRLITGAKKGKPLGRKFWDGLAYTKIVTFGRQFKNTSNYVFRNMLEAFGVIPPRKDARGHLKIDFISLFDG